MNAIEVMQAAARASAAGEPVALVTVVRAEPPASARPGDKAVVHADGRFEGWIGGGCAQPAVIKTVREALGDGRSRIIRIAPADQEQRPLSDVLEFGMACHSGGTLELLIDPILPRPQLLIFGTSPVAYSLAQLAPRVGFDVIVASPDATATDFADAREVIATDDAAQLAARVAPGGYVVVATQGRRDLQALRAALAVRATHVACVCSARKGQVLKDLLCGEGQDAARVAAISAPAGYPIAAKTPEEIALSVLAALVAARRGGAVQQASCCEPTVSEAAVIEPPVIEPRPQQLTVPPAGSCCGS
jgi:xanthine dehydrogenase accessory factor